MNHDGVCEICYRESGTPTCAECAGWKSYWDGLSDEDRRAEDEAMALYAQEASDRGV